MKKKKQNFKYNTPEKRKALIEEFKKSGLTRSDFAKSKNLDPSTMYRYLSREKHVPSPSESPVKGSGNTISLGVKREAVRENVLKGTPLSRIARRLGLHDTTCNYWKKNWREGKLIIPGLPAGVNITENQKGVVSSKPLRFDTTSAQEIERLKAQIRYLKEILLENEIDFSLKTYDGPAKQRYLVSLIEANGIIVDLEPDDPYDERDDERDDEY